MTKALRLSLLLLVLFAGLGRPAAALDGDRLDWPVRGKTLTLTLYGPATPKGTVIMASGDVGWVGLAVTMAQHLSAQGYLVVGINVRQYLSAFTVGTSHLMPAEVQSDYGQLAAFLRSRQLLTGPVILSGVSEGAALSVLGASAAANHAWVTGTITMGLPATAEIAWRWSDFTSWITKKDASEPSFSSRDYLGGVAPRPLVMIQSTKDEYVPPSEYRDLNLSAREPHRQVLIDASNHRFTDRMPELRRAFDEALVWVCSQPSI